MILCPKVPNPCTEQFADKFNECEYAGFYVDVKNNEIHGYCFTSVKDKCPKSNQRGDV